MKNFGALLFLLFTRHSECQLLNSTNDSCGFAIPISAGDFVIDSTVGAEFEAGSGDINLLRCREDGIFPIDVPGRWYWYQSESPRNLQLSTCAEETNFENRITVFSLEENSCATRSCVASSNEAHASCPYGNGTVVEFSTLPGIIYAILVSDESYESSGDFGLSLFDSTVPPDGFSCDNPITIKDGETIQGSTFSAALNTGLQCERCIQGGPSNRGMFYYIPPVGSSTGITISLAGSTIPFDLRVYEGLCDEFECRSVATESQGLSTFASWSANTNEDFYVYVSATDTGEDTDLTGLFGLRMDLEKEDPGNESSSFSIPFPVWSSLLSTMLVFL